MELVNFHNWFWLLSLFAIVIAISFIALRIVVQLLNQILLLTIER